jgi:hypothetical protein
MFSGPDHRDARPRAAVPSAPGGAGEDDVVERAIAILEEETRAWLQRRRDLTWGGEGTVAPEEDEGGAA